MDINCGEFDIVYGQQKVGTAYVSRLGIRYEVSAAVKSAEISVPFRLAAVCGERIAALGVMMPEGEGFGFKRSFSPNDLKNMGIKDITCFTIVSAEKSLPTLINKSEQAVWKITDEPWQYLEDGEFRRVFSACSEALVCEGGEFTSIAVPVIKDEPFPLMSIFCLGEIQKIEGKLNLVFKLHEGKLLF